MNIKDPVVIDISRYEIINDFSKILPRPFLVITKATEGTTYIDPTFTTYMAGIKSAGIHRGCYHFHRKAYSSLTQAQHFCNTIRQHIDDKTLLVLDVEEGGETGAQLASWIAEVKRQYPKNLIMIYSRKNILDPIAMTAAQKDTIRQCKIWTAGYPADPDLYDTVPDFYIPDQAKYGEVWLWQYSEKGIFEGIVGATDVNWVFQKLVDYLGGTQPPPPGGDMYEATLNQGLNIRNGVGTSGTNVLLTAQAGDKIIAARVPEHSWFVIDHCIIGGQRWDPPVQAYCSSWEGYYSSIVEYVPPAKNKLHAEIDLLDDGTVSGTWQQL